MRLHAYVLAADPAWAAPSLRSYYHLVEQVIVSYDVDGLSWAGEPTFAPESLAALRSADPDGKLRLLPGHHHDPTRNPLEVETEQRQAALNAASEGSDWVLQLDTDEVALAPSTLNQHIQIAQGRAAEALEFPLRDIYQELGDGKFLERCGRWWTAQGAFPGPVAVKSGAILTHCRQTDSSLYRVDLRPWNTDPAHPRHAPVHGIVSPNEAIAHLSWVRSEDQLAWKLKSRTSYSSPQDWQRKLRAWRWRGRHPLLTVVTAPLRCGDFEHHRITRLDQVVRPEVSS